MKKYIFLFFLITTNILTCFSQTRYHVSITGSPTDNALSWATACNDLQLVINNASANDTIWVAQGIYYPIRPADSLNKIDSGNRENSFVLNKSIHVYGGFNGTETILSQRDWENNITVLDGDIGVLNDSMDNVYHVVRISANVLIDGFTIRNGNTKGVSDRGGGGIYKKSGILLLSNSTISHNIAIYNGGGICSERGSTTLENNLISYNQAIVTTDHGVAGIWLDDTNIIFDNNIISFNDGRFAVGIGQSHQNIKRKSIIKNNSIHNNMGGGLIIGDGFMSILYEGDSNDGSTHIIDNSFFNNLDCGIFIFNRHTTQIIGNHIDSNQGHYYTGGIEIANHGNLLIENNVISNNVHNNIIRGGGIDIWTNRNSIITITNNIICNNYTANGGGGIHDISCGQGILLIINNLIYNNKACYGGGISSSWTGGYCSVNTILLNNLIYNNHADSSGGGVYVYRMPVNDKPNMVLINNTIVNNYASLEGGGIYSCLFYNRPVTTHIRNNILWGNMSGNDVADDISHAGEYASTVLSNCLVGSLPLGNGVISNVYPLFVDTANHNYRLTQCSPAIDVGNNAFFSPDSFPDISSIITDLDSNPRFFNNGIVDLGAYEYQAVLSVNLGNDTVICNGESVQVIFTLTGIPNWDIVYTKDGGNSYDTLKNITASPYILTDTFTQTTIYELVSITNHACDEVLISGQKTITVIPVPTLDNILSNDTLYDGEQTKSVVFTGTADQYQWIVSGSVSGLPTGAQTGDFGTYTVGNSSSFVQTSTITITPQDTSGGIVCNGDLRSFQIIVYPPILTLTISSNGFVFCEKETLVMEASGENFTSYQWYKDGNPLSGQTNKRYVVSQLMSSQSGTYYVKANGYYGEQQSNAITISVSAGSILVEKWDDVLLVDNSSESYFGYQWYKDGIMIPGATNQFYQELGGLNGCYKVNLTLKSGKKEMTCERCLDNVKKSLSIYPNPVKQGESVNVSLYNENQLHKGLMEIRLYSAEGKLLQTKQSYCGNMEINTFGLSTGIYILKITTEDGLIHNEKIGVY